MFAAAGKAQDVINGLPEVRQTFIPQESDYPTLDIKVDRIKAARLGLTQKDVVHRRHHRAQLEHDNRAVDLDRPRKQE